MNTRNDYTRNHYPRSYYNDYVDYTRNYYNDYVDYTQKIHSLYQWIHSIYMGSVPNMDMQTPHITYHSFDPTSMKDVQCAVTNEKQFSHIFDFYCLSYRENSSKNHNF